MRAPAVTNSLVVSASSHGRLPAGPYGVVEHPVVVAERLVGIMSAPSEPAIPTAAVVMVTTGTTSRAGPGGCTCGSPGTGRASASSSRAIDLGGAGDSALVGDAHTGGTSYDPWRAIEVEASVAWLAESTGVHDIVLFGVCSGAFNAFHAALRGARVRGIVLANPAIFYLGPEQTLAGSLDRAVYSANTVTRALTSPSRWARLLWSKGALSHAWRRVRDLFREKAFRGIVYIAQVRLRHLLVRLRIAPRGHPRSCVISNCSRDEMSTSRSSSRPTSPASGTYVSSAPSRSRRCWTTARSSSFTSKAAITSSRHRHPGCG